MGIFGANGFTLPHSPDGKYTTNQTMQEIVSLKQENERLRQENTKLIVTINRNEVIIEKMDKELKKISDIIRLVPNPALLDPPARGSIITPESPRKPAYSLNDISPKDKKFMLKAIDRNMLLKQFTETQKNEMVNYMQTKILPMNFEPVKQGEKGDSFYIIASGTCGVLQVLSNIWFLQDLKKRKLAKIADSLEEERFSKGEYITKEGTFGDTFFIIKEGEVSVRQLKEGEEFEIRRMGKNESFGEQAIRSNTNIRTASVVAESDVVVVYTIDKEPFCELIGDLAPDPSRKSSTINPGEVQSVPENLINKTLRDDFEQIKQLGKGSYGRVDLIKDKTDDTLYALKCINRHQTVKREQQNYVVNERNVMLECTDCLFTVRLYRTFHNPRYVYFLLEPCRGGELWRQLQKEQRFPESRARFYAACVVEALSYLHKRNIVHRDIKPENLLLDAHGYVKVCDFGLAKKLTSGERTGTMCGTAEYIPPEMYLHNGHDVAVDYWALGILIYEMLNGTPPFKARTKEHTFKMMLRGIDAIDMPISMQKPARNLVKRLCRENPTERLGYLALGVEGIVRHKWFNTFNWTALRSRTMNPSFIPGLRHSFDAPDVDYGENDYDYYAVDDHTDWAKDF